MATPELPPSPLPDRPDPRGQPSGWAVGGLTFAACAMTIVGAFQVIAGLTAVIDDDFFVVLPNYTFNLDASAWGWIHLVIGAILLAVAFGLFARSPWAGAAAIGIATVSAIANFFFIPFYPLWAVVIIALDVWIIWSVTRSGVLDV